MNDLVNSPIVFAKQLPAHGNVPNSVLPLLLYERAVRLQSDDPASVFEELFAENGWTNSWRNGIYDYHHYHSNTHEVLGIYRGTVSVQLGGDAGVVKRVSAGDVIIIPAGVAHKNLGASPDLGVVGAYPEGTEPDLLEDEPDQREKARARIKGVSVPGMDPVYGADGPLTKHWH